MKEFFYELSRIFSPLSECSNRMSAGLSFTFDRSNFNGFNEMIEESMNRTGRRDLPRSIKPIECSYLNPLKKKSEGLKIQFQVI